MTTGHEMQAYAEAVLCELYRIVREEKRPGDDAVRTSDLVQDVFLRIEPAWRRGEDLESLIPLAATVARRLLIDYWRRRKPQLLPGEVFEKATLACQDLGIEPLDFEAYMAELGERQRSVLDLRLFAGYSRDQIAAALSESAYFINQTLKEAESRLETLRQARS